MNWSFERMDRHRRSVSRHGEGAERRIDVRLPYAKGRQWRGAEFLLDRAIRLSVPSRWCSRSLLHLKAAHRVPDWSRLVRYRPDRPEELCTFFHRESRFAESHAAAETAETPVGFPGSFCHRPIRYRDRNTLVAAVPP